VISKLGLASRTAAAQLVEGGRVSVNGRLVRDPEFPVRQGEDRIAIDGRPQTAANRLVLMLNKPRGLVTSASDEEGRDTVYRCLEGAALPWLAPVGRLDKASEGLLLFSNDPVWAAQITSPDSGPLKTYHVQVASLPDAAMLAAIARGVVQGAEHLRVRSVRVLRSAHRTAWLEIALDEGRNRQIRRVLEAFALRVLRLVRVQIGPLALGALAKGRWRLLDDAEIASLAPPVRGRARPPPAPRRTD
jgi:23S rRNA pseudouridine2605 synthase